MTGTIDNTNNTRMSWTTITKKPKCEDKQHGGYLKQKTCKISHDKTWKWERKKNLKRETESLLMAAQNNAIRTNYVKAKIDKAPQNSKYKLRRDRDETINHMINECS